VERLVTVAADSDATSSRVVASGEDWMLELKFHRLCISLLRVETSAVSAKNLLDALGRAPGYVGDLGARRSRQG
jgi:hypothetical protein